MPNVVRRIGAVFVLAGSLVLCVPAFADAQTAVAARVAPPFARADLQRNEVSLTAYRGQVVLLNFWASWCSACLSEMPRFVAWQKDYRDRGLQIVGVSMDDDEAPARAVYRKLKVNYPVVMGDAALGNLYGGVLGFPTTYLIDRAGQIRFQSVGTADLGALQDRIEALLEAK